MDLNGYLEDLINGGDLQKKSFEVKLPSGDHTLTHHIPGVFEFHPKGELKKAPPLILSCGIHGNETAPIEMVADLLVELQNGELKCLRPLQLIFGHLKAMPLHQRFIDFNLNRLFCGLHGEHLQAQESQRAKELEDSVKKFSDQYGVGIHLDLHTAIRPSHLRRFAIYPTMGNEIPSEDEVILLKAMGIQGLLLSGGKASTFSAFSHRELGHSSFTLELGKVEPFGKNNRADFQESYDTLKALIENKSNEELKSSYSRERELTIYEVVHEMIREDESYQFHISEDYANFTPFHEGDLLETTSKGTLKAKKGQAVVFPNSQVKIGQRSGLLIEKSQII